VVTGLVGLNFELKFGSGASILLQFDSCKRWKGGAALLLLLLLTLLLLMLLLGQIGAHAGAASGSKRNNLSLYLAIGAAHNALDHSHAVPHE